MLMATDGQEQKEIIHFPYSEKNIVHIKKNLHNKINVFEIN